MATNPMQKKARNSILLGILIGLLIGAIVIVILFLQLNKLQQEKKATEAATKVVYVFSADIKSGDKIDVSKLQKKSATMDVVPSDYLGMDQITENTIAKVDIAKGSVLSKSIVNESSQKVTADLREQQYNMIVLPQYLEEGSYVDIRLMLPNGSDYIVVAKKQIKQITEDTIWIDMYEQETLLLSNAIVEAYQMKGSKLYATTYVDAGNQNIASVTYMPNNAVTALINNDPNIVATAMKELQERYTQGIRERREQDINSQLNRYNEEAKDNLEAGIEQEITKSKENRKKYLDSLNAGTME